MNLIASNKQIVVLGLGITGLSVARYLKIKKRYFILMDLKKTPQELEVLKREFPDNGIYLGDFDQSILLDSTQIIISPGISLQTPQVAAAIAAGVEVIGDVELFARELSEHSNPTPVVAITGSNAKTTVTTLVGQMAQDSGLKVGVGGNIGTPVLDLLRQPFDIYVLELSSFQLETTTSLKPEVASILNLTMDHMDRYDSFMDYYRAKQRIYFGAKNIVINRADPLTHAPLAQGVNCYSFGPDQPDRNGFGITVQDAQPVIVHEFSTLLSVGKLAVRGQHNIINCIAALTIGYVCGLCVKSMLLTLQKFQGLPHRCQWITNIDGVDFINDSKATNVGATVAALAGFDNGKKNMILIAGGLGKGADFSPLNPLIEKVVALLILIGRDAGLMAETVGDYTKIEFTKSLKEAVTIAKSHATTGTTVLLSPACASFDMFTSYEDRGNQFIDAVEAMVA